jgi:hypothetical protein
MTLGTAPYVPSMLDVGGVLVGRPFVVTPEDALEFDRSRHFFHGGVEGLQSLRRTPPRPARASACDPTLVLARAAGSVLAELPWRRDRLTVRSLGHVRYLAAPQLQDALVALGTVRFVRPEEGGCIHVTLDVEVRHRGGRLLSTFEMGVECSSGPLETVQPSPWDLAA